MAVTRSVVPAFAVLALAGCLQEEKLVKVKGDGSGTLVVTTRMMTWAIEQIEKQGMKPSAITEETAKARAEKLGKGVAFVSAEPLKDERSRGIRATYSFKDIATLRLNESGPPPFRFARPAPGKAVLTCVLGNAAASASPPSAAGSNDLPYAARRAILAGMKFTTKVEVGGTIVHCSSRHVDGPTVTLLEVDLDAMLGEEDRLLAAEPPATIEESRKLVSDLQRWMRFRRAAEMGAEEAAAAVEQIPGLKFAPEKETVIEFTPRE